MKNALILSLAGVLLLASTAPCASQGPLTVKGFHLGMDRDAVQAAFQALLDANVAETVSLEREPYRDLITVENELGSMGNKVELAYNEDGVVTGLTFQHTTVDILFDAAAESAEAFVARFCGEYDLPGMERDDQGFVTLWTFKNEEGGYQVSIDNGKNLRIQRLTS